MSKAADVCLHGHRRLPLLVVEPGSRVYPRLMCAFTLLLASYLLYVSYSARTGRRASTAEGRSDLEYVPRGRVWFTDARRRYGSALAVASARHPPAGPPVAHETDWRTDGRQPQPRERETPDDVMKVVKDRDVRFIRLWFTDVLGQLKSFSINAAELDDAFEGGMGFDGSSITGFNPIEESDMIAHARPADLRGPALAARREGDRADVLRHPGARRRARTRAIPRWILRRALKRAEEMGFDDLQHRPRAGVLLLPLGEARRRSAGDPRRGRLLRPDDARRRAPTSGGRPSWRWSSSASTSSTRTTRSAPPSTRSTCATRTRSRCRTTA